jgi:hypothetical protein
LARNKIKILTLRANGTAAKERLKVNAYYEGNVGSEHSKSANAAQAEAEGRYPMTVAAKKLGISTKAFKAGCRSAKYESSEWHHTGSHARRTDYYDTTTLSTDADFWRGAARQYSDKKAAAILAEHNVSPLRAAELALATQSGIRAALGRVEAFLAWFDGPRYVVQELEDRGPDFAVKGYSSQTAWKAALHYNSAMDMLGVTTGYDASSNFKRIHSTPEAAQAWLAVWQERHAKSFPEKAALVLRVVTILQDIETDCALYGRVAGEFKRLGEARDYLTQTPQGANPVASVNSSDESAPTPCEVAQPTAEVECSVANGQPNNISGGFIVQGQMCVHCAKSWDDCNCKARRHAA